MLYKELTIGDKEYKLVLNAKSAVDCERRLGKNPINVLVDVANNQSEMPSLEALLCIFHASLQKYQHGFDIDKAYDLYDEYIADGHEMADLIALLMEVFEVSGFFKQAKENKDPNPQKASK